ncbi:hypothetical protein RJT34_03449 [Clitoria ternatea]|uniref:Glucosyltransferase 24 catalytic domain-containing protein n=1 Tax=Clitoria ternatea TaxID=43366 RepID=A0AAN9KM81_CLITE
MDISFGDNALYAVDLKTFRETAAGDNLRVFYETLSKDPNSLANLDQDLPNYAQHSVPIFSLPREWLWCEAWCVNATKYKAKSIDLCNNPMTKEPKLSYEQDETKFVQVDSIQEIHDYIGIPIIKDNNYGESNEDLHSQLANSKGTKKI